MLKLRVLLVLNTLFILLSLVIIIYIILPEEDNKISTKFEVTYFPNTVGVAVYEITGENTMKCNLTTVNRIIENMIIYDSFYIEKDNSYDYLLDIIITNGIDYYRIFYNRRTKNFLSISKDFLKNNIPVTYILE